jgi:hypothetical protein
VADHQPGVLRSYKEFAEQMSDVPAFKLLSDGKRNLLLRELYELASDKDQADRAGQIAKEAVGEFRAEKNRAQKASKLLSRALQVLRDACTLYHHEFLVEIEDSAPDCELNFTFAEMEKNLHFSVEWLKAHAAVQAAVIHPKLRNGQEKRLVKERMVLYKQTAESAVAMAFPVSEKMRELDTWLILDAAELIAKYLPSLRPSILNRSIVRLFHAAFGDSTRTDDGIRKALLERRRTKKKRPVGYQYTVYRALVADAGFLKQKNPCSDSVHRQTK